jgi:hypothetical protein
MTSVRKLSLVAAGLLLPLAAQAQTPAPAAPVVTPAVPAEPPPVEAAPPVVPAPETPKKRTPTAGLGLAPGAPQAAGRITSPAEPPPVVAAEPSAEWKFDVTGYFRAPLRFSWGPALGQDPNAFNPNTGVYEGHPGTQLRTPPLVPDANYIDWRYTNSLVGPWTELNFHYGNDRVKATVQIASYNLTDPGYRRLESNLGINQAYLTLSWPEWFGSENWHLTLTVGGFTNRYGAAGRYDGGKYETYLFGRTHVAGWTTNISYDVSDTLTLVFEHGFGAKLEPIPFYGPPNQSAPDPLQKLPAWEPYPGPVAQESTFVHHLHGGAILKGPATQLILGAHLIHVFANDNDRSSSYIAPGHQFDPPGMMMGGSFDVGGRPANDPKPYMLIWGADAKLLSGPFGDGYLGFSYLKARNALYISDAIELLHSFGGWQLHDNYFGKPGGTDPVTGSIKSVEFQYVFSLASFFYYPQAFWGQGPDVVISLFGMLNQSNIDDAQNNPYDGIKKFKWGTDLTYTPLEWLGVGYRFDYVDPAFGWSQGERSMGAGFLDKFMVFSPRVILRTAFVTHEQILIQYSRYFADEPLAGLFPYNQQPGGAAISGTDKNAFNVAAIIWF